MKKLIPALFLCFVACQLRSHGAKQVADKPALLEFFVMSQCPYGVQVMSAIAPVVEKLGGNLDFRVNYIGDKTEQGFSSMHGDAEVAGDIVQLCAAKLAPYDFMKLVACQNKAPQSVDTNWQECAEPSGIDAKALASCIEGGEGKQLLEASFTMSQQRGATGSPTMFLNGKPYEGGRKSNDFMRSICNELGGEKPEACKTLATPPKVTAIFLSDTRCAACNIEGLEPRLKSDIGGLEVTRLDYMSDAGKKLYADLKAKDATFKYLPAVLFDASIEKDSDGMQAVQRWLHPIGDYRALALGGNFDPTAEICDNKLDDDGNKAVDCADSSCHEQMVCRPEKAKNLDLFVMSQCPYGAKAVTAMQEVIDNFKGDLNLNVHFIGDTKNGQLASMHGPAEVEEDIRQACVLSSYPKGNQFMKYLGCRAADYQNPSWETCTGTNGINADVIKKCVEKQGSKLLEKDFTLAGTLGINSSPTFLANNRYTFNGIDADTIKSNFCKYNSSLKGCGATLTKDTGGVKGSCK